MSGMQAMRDRVMRHTGRNPTVRDFLEITRRGRPREAVVGSGKDVADRLEQWFVEGACDGFVVAGTHMPGSFEDFVASWCRSCSGAGCTGPTIPARRCGRISPCRCRHGERGGWRRQLYSRVCALYPSGRVIRYADAIGWAGLDRGPERDFGANRTGVGARRAHGAPSAEGDHGAFSLKSRLSVIEQVPFASEHANG